MPYKEFVKLANTARAEEKYREGLAAACNAQYADFGSARGYAAEAKSEVGDTESNGFRPLLHAESLTDRPWVCKRVGKRAGNARTTCAVAYDRSGRALR